VESGTEMSYLGFAFRWRRSLRLAAVVGALLLACTLGCAFALGGVALAFGALALL
jgi:hypothetical protein